MVCVIGSTRSYFATSGPIKASRTLFRKLLHRILHTPLHFIDATPAGRILNRFSGDFNSVDAAPGDDVRSMLSHGMDILMAIVPTLVVNPFLLTLRSKGPGRISPLYSARTIGFNTPGGKTGRIGWGDFVAAKVASFEQDGRERIRAVIEGQGFKLE